MTESGATSADVREFFLARLEGPLSAKGLAPSETPLDYDLLSEGIIDSFGIIELIGDLEDRFRVTLDFDEVEPETFTIVGPLSEYVADLIERRS
jgi:acyl carrier protein